MGLLVRNGISYGGNNNTETYTEVIGTLTAGETEITLSDASITEDSTIDPYTSVYGVNPTNMVATTGSVTLTFDAREADLGVKVRVW